MRFASSPPNFFAAPVTGVSRQRLTLAAAAAASGGGAGQGGEKRRTGMGAAAVATGAWPPWTAVGAAAATVPVGPTAPEAGRG